MDPEKIRKPKNLTLIIIGLAIAIIIFVSIRFSVPTKILDLFNEDLKNENRQLQVQKDSIIRAREKDSIFYSEIIKDLIEKNQEIKSQIKSANYKIQQYEEAFRNYNPSDFHPNFVLFTNFVTGSRAVQDE